MIHCVVYLHHLNINCFITFLFGYPQHHIQKEIWETLLNIKNSVIGPWTVVDDFNEILNPHENIGGTITNSSRMQNFAKFIDNCHMMELESFGLPYTWFNKRT